MILTLGCKLVGMEAFTLMLPMIILLYQVRATIRKIIRKGMSVFIYGLPVIQQPSNLSNGLMVVNRGPDNRPLMGTTDTPELAATRGDPAVIHT